MPTFGCLECSHRFFSMDALFNHCSSTGHSSGCKRCNKGFQTTGALEQHIEHSSAHYHDRSTDEVSDDSSEDEEEDVFCSKCDRYFVNAAALNQHRMNNSEHNWCSVCARDFATATGLDQHIQYSSAHQDSRSDESSDESSEDEEAYCLKCNRYFVDAAALNQHRLKSLEHNWCSTCERDFTTSAGLDQHIRDSPAHYDSSSDESEEEEEEERFCSKCSRFFVDGTALYQHRLNNSEHNWCFVCAKDFKTIEGLNQHTLSGAHKQKEIQLSGQGKEFECLFCDKEFGQPSAVAMHIESGCHKVTRHQVTAAVHKLKIVPTISINHRLEGPILPTVIITYSATELAFNGTAYECYLCHDTFRTLKGLNAHLKSPAHDDNEFKCPGKKCRSEFKLVSGLIQHIECGTCGVAKFKEVQDQFESLTDQFSRTLKL